jgi:hypothetical protein
MFATAAASSHPSDLYLAITLSYSASSPICGFSDLIKEGLAPSMYTVLVNVRNSETRQEIL